MKRKKERIDTSPERDALGDTPLASLGERMSELPSGPEDAPSPKPAAQPERRWSVGKTRKGGYPLSVEKRAAGKTVTVLGNVEGDGKALLSELKRKCGAGGATRGETVELQGDHRAAVEAFLREKR